MNDQERIYKMHKTDQHALGDKVIKSATDPLALTEIEEILLSRADTIRNGAMVMTYEGMRALGNMFASSVKKAIREELGTVVEQAVKDNMLEMIQGQLLGMAKYLSGKGEINIVPEIKVDMAETRQELGSDHEVVPEVMEAKKIKLVDTRLINARPMSNSTLKTKKNSEIVAQALRDYGQAVSLQEIIMLTRENFKWGNNQTEFMKGLMKCNDHIQRLTYGIYQYKD